MRKNNLVFKKKTSMNVSYKLLLRNLVGISFSEETASAHYCNIENHQDILMASTGRDVAFSVAALDYFTFLEPTLKNPCIMEEKEYKNILTQNYTDSLTGVYLKKCLPQRLAEEIYESQRARTVFSVVFIDIDDFRFVNNNYGHRAGDIVLEQLAYLMKCSTRKHDAIFRYGGEEFVIVMPDTRGPEAFRFVERLRKRVAKKPVRIDGDIKICATLSGGISCYPDDTQSPEKLIEMADKAMYAAKKRGKNKILQFCYTG